MKTKITLAVLVLLIATAAVYLPALKGSFTNWDDDKIVTKSPLVTQLSWQNLKKICTSFHYHHYHPLVTLSLALEYRFFRDNPFPYHLTNLILHLCNTALVFWLIWLLCRGMTAAFLTALLFGIHPLHVESVAWIAERKDVLYAFFFFAAAVAYIYYRQNNNRRLYGATLLLFLLSLLSKAMAMTLPVILLLIDYLLRRPPGRKLWTDKIPFFVLSGAFGVIAVASHYPATNIQNTFAVTFFHKTIIAGYSVLFYLKKMIAPAQLSCIYPYPQLAGWDVYWYCPVICLLLFIAALISMRYTRKIIFGALFFIVTLLPVLQFFPVGHTIVADRFTYVPLTGIFFIIGTAAQWTYDRIARHPFFRWSCRITVFAACAAVAYTARAQVATWQDSFSLWNHVIRHYPSVAIAYNNRGNILGDRGEFDAAIADFNRAAELDPTNANVYNNRGFAYSGKKEFDRALADFSRAVDIDPTCATAYNNRGNIYNLTGRLDEALADYNKALEFEPGNPGAYNNRGVIHFARGNYEKAVADYTTALAMRPDFPEAYLNRGKVSCKLGSLESGIADFTRAVTVNPRFALGYYSRAQAYLSLKEYDKAWADIQQVRALGYQPDPSLLKALQEASGRETP